jgi:hypothetical protein
MTEQPPPAQPAIPWLAYRAGETDSGGAKILELVASTPSYSVYLTEPESLAWQIDMDICVDAHLSTAEAVILGSQVNTTIGRKRIRLRAKHAIGLALAKALQDRVAGDQRSFFVEPREYIDALRRESLHLHYLLSAFLAAVAIATGGIALHIVVPSADFILAALLGSVGVFVSVAQRFRTIPIERYSSSLYTSIAGVSRILLGAIFGSLFLLLHKSDLVLSLARQQPYLLATASFVAGFSERLVPEMLERFESKMTSDEKTA